MLRSQFNSTEKETLWTGPKPRLTWPDAVTFREAVQTPAVSFGDASLRASTLSLDRRGLPVTYAGRFAVVFRATLPDGESWALRCFTTPGDEYGGIERAHRYRAIEKYVNEERSVFVPFRYLEQGVKIAGTWYPTLAMRWASGVPLGRWVEANRRDPAALRNLADALTALLNRLEASGIAHGDWQHDNLIISDNGRRITLVDYDGMYVPELAGEKSVEIGHANYQHPRRTAEHFGVGLDRFACHVMRTALLGLAQEPTLWERFSDGESLLFKKADLSDPATAPLIHELRHLAEAKRDAELADALARLEDALVSDPMATMAPDVATPTADGLSSLKKTEYAPIKAGTLSKGLPAKNGSTQNGVNGQAVNGQSLANNAAAGTKTWRGGKWWTSPETVTRQAQTLGTLSNFPAEYKYLARVLSSEILRKEREHIRQHRVLAALLLALVMTVVTAAIWTQHYYFFAFFGWLFGAGPFGYGTWPRKAIADELDAEIKKIETLIAARNAQIEDKLRSAAGTFKLQEYTDEWLRHTSINRLFASGIVQIPVVRKLHTLKIENAYDLQRVPLNDIPPHQAVALLNWTRTVEAEAAADYRKAVGKTSTSPVAIDSLRHEIGEFERYLLQLRRQREQFPDTSIETYLAYLLGRETVQGTNASP